MSVKITSVKSKGRFRSETVEHALGNRGDVQTWELNIDVATYNAASTKHEIMVNATDGFVGTGWVFDKSGGFTDFRIGDTVLFHNKTIGPANNQTFTITDKLDGSSIRLSAKVKAPGNLIDLANNSKLNNCIFSVSTPITALRYNYNFIENDGPVTYKSKISGTTQELVIKTISASVLTVLPMEFLGEPSYQTGSATAQGIAIDITTGVYTSKFKILHQNKILPYPTAEERVDALAAVKPEYFFDDKCLKFIYNIEACTDYTNPNWLQGQLIQDVKGNTGAYSENFNTGTTKYSIDGLTILSGVGLPLTAIQLSEDEQSIEFRIKNTTDTPFSNNNTKFELQFLKLPFDESEEKLNGRTVDANFIDDRAFQTVGAASINGEQFGVATRQVLKTVVGTFISTSEIKITCKIKMLPGTLAVFAESEISTYVFNVAVQNHTLETKKADLVRLPISILPFFIDYSSPGIIEFENTYYKHWEGGSDGSKVNEPGEGFSNLPLFPEDEVTPYTKFFVDKTFYPNDKISIESLTARIKVKNSVTGQEATLDGFTFPFGGTPLMGGNQFVDYTTDRVFKIPPAEIRKKIHIRRNPAMDNGNKYAYEVIFPFLNRWEYWEKLAFPAGVGDDFFDPNEPNNGQNHNWYRLSTFPDWGVYYELKVIGLRNGKPFTAVFENQFTLYHYDNNDTWDPNTIKSYDKDTAVELTDGVKKFIQSFKDTRVEASFTSTLGTPDMSKIVVNMKIEPFEGGGVTGSRRMSSKWPSALTGDETWFRSIDTSNKTLLTLVGNTVLANVLVDHLKLPAGIRKVSIASRLYDALTIPHCICPDGWTAVISGTSSYCQRMSSNGEASKEANNLTLGYHGGLTYNVLNGSGDPTFFSSNLSSFEGCTTISDTNGNLLFYSNGQILYKPDGTTALDTLGNPINYLRSHPQSQSNSFAIKHPAIAGAYLLFCVDESAGFGGSNYGITYNIIRNVTTSGLTLDPAEANIQLYSGNPRYVAEIAVCRKNPDGSYWIITEEPYGFGPAPARFVAIKLKTDGTFESPVFSDALTPKQTNSGQAKISSDGTLFAKCLFEGSWDLYHFDENTGLISDGLNIDFAVPFIDENPYSYGVEFSPNSKIVYVGGISGRDLYQYDISTYTKVAIDASRVLVATFPAEVHSVGNLQAAPNNTVLIALKGNGAYFDQTNGVNYIAKIKDPDVLGVGCNVSNGTTIPFIPLNANAPGVYAATPGNNVSLLSLPTFEKSLTTSTETMPCGERPPPTPPPSGEPLIVAASYLGVYKVDPNDNNGVTMSATEDVSYRIKTQVFESDGVTQATDTAFIKLRITDTDAPTTIIFEATWSLGDDINTDAPASQASTLGLAWAGIKVYLAGIVGQGGEIRINKQDLAKANNLYDNATLKAALAWTMQVTASRTSPAQVSNLVILDLPYLYSVRSWAEESGYFRKTNAVAGTQRGIAFRRLGDTIAQHIEYHAGLSFANASQVSSWAASASVAVTPHDEAVTTVQPGNIKNRHYVQMGGGLQGVSTSMFTANTGFLNDNVSDYTLFVLNKFFAENTFAFDFEYQRQPAPTYTNTSPFVNSAAIYVIKNPTLTLVGNASVAGNGAFFPEPAIYAKTYNTPIVADSTPDVFEEGGIYAVFINLIHDHGRSDIYSEYLIERY